MYSYYSSRFLLYSKTVTIETRTITAFAVIVPVRVIIIMSKIGEAALNTQYRVGYALAYHLFLKVYEVIESIMF